MKMKPAFINSFQIGDNEIRVNKLIDSLPVGIILHGPGTEILFSNQTALDILGLTEDEIYQRTSFHPEWSFIHEDGTAFEGITHPVSRAIATKKPVYNFVMGVYRSDTKDKVWLLVNAEPQLDEEGDVLEVICSFSDITRYKNAEEELQWLYQKLEVRALELSTSNAELERFAYVATHDLQEPLRIVCSFLQLLEKKYENQLDEQAYEYINFAIEGSNRMKKLLKDLLEFTKVSSNKEEPVLTDLNLVVKETCLLLENEIKAADAEIIIPDLPVINVHTQMMGMLFENLIGNALKYKSCKKPVIQIDYKEEENKYMFSVSDNGIGIDPKYSERIFVLFKRLHNDNYAYEGTGLGLAICKKIVERHGGNIWVESEEGEGSTFHFTIARHQNQAL